MQPIAVETIIAFVAAFTPVAISAINREERFLNPVAVEAILAVATLAN